MDGVGKLERIGKYDVLDVLGQGGMGVVYRARDPVIGRQVAIKVILDRALDAPAVRERFYREARSAGALSHENVMTIYDVGEDDGRPYIVMELLDGTDLRHLLARRPLPTLDTRLDIALQVCQGLGYAHSRGIVHRDIKPENVQVTTSGRVKLLDFGIARIQTETHTLTQAQIGTPRYMSPEQIKGEPIDGRTDIFSFGVLLYELLSGANPFAGEHITSVIYKVLHEDPPPPALPDTQAGRDLQRVVARCLSKSPHRRYAKFAEVSEALRAVRAAGFATAPEPPAAKPGLFGWLRRDTPIATPPPILPGPAGTSSSTLPAPAPPPLRSPAADTGATVFPSAPPPLDATVILPREERDTLSPPPFPPAPWVAADLEAQAPADSQEADDIDDDVLDGLVTRELHPDNVDVPEIDQTPATGEPIEALIVEDPHDIAGAVEGSDGAEAEPFPATDAEARAAEAIDTDAPDVAPSTEALPEPGVPVPYLGAIAGVTLSEEEGTIEVGPGEDGVLAEDHDVALDGESPVSDAAEEMAPEDDLTAPEPVDSKVTEGVDGAPASPDETFAFAPPARDESPEAESDVPASADETLAFATPTLDEPPEAEADAPATPDETFAFASPALDELPEVEADTPAPPEETLAFATPAVDEPPETESDAPATPDEAFAFAPPALDEPPAAETEVPASPDETFEFPTPESDSAVEAEAPASPDETFAFPPPALEGATEGEAEAPYTPDETFALPSPPTAATDADRSEADETFEFAASGFEASSVEDEGDTNDVVVGDAPEHDGPPLLFSPPQLATPAEGPDAEPATAVPPLPGARKKKERRGKRDTATKGDRPPEERADTGAERRTDTGTLIPPLPAARSDTGARPISAAAASTATAPVPLRPSLGTLAIEEPRPRRRALLFGGAAVVGALAIALVYVGLSGSGRGENGDDSGGARHVDPPPPEGLVALGTAARAEVDRMTVQRDSAVEAGVRESPQFVAALALETEAREALERGGEAGLLRATEAAREAAGLFTTARLSATATAAELRERATQAERAAATARQAAVETRGEPGATGPFDRAETALAGARRAAQGEDFAEAARLYAEAERGYRASRAAGASRVAAADVERQRVVAARARSRAMASASDGPLLASAEREYSGAARNARNGNFRAALTGYESAARLYGQAVRDPDPDPIDRVGPTPPADVLEAARRADAARETASGNTGSAAYRRGERARTAAAALMRSGQYADARSLYLGARAAFEEAARGGGGPTPAVSPVPSIGQYAAELQRAFETENLGALRAFHPYFNRYAGLFQNADDIHATVATAPPDISGTRATVGVTLSLRYQADGRTESPPPVRLRWTLEQRGSSWRLIDVASR